ncbi:MAG: hypothetical protein KDI36_19600, partial [Pseudomonadales bacterium]|nr:hypothetical protein [Pseudomonadales bacterium]
FGDDLIATEHAGNRVIRLAQGGPVELLKIEEPSALLKVGGDLYTASWTSGEILQIGANNTMLAQARTVASGFSRPEGLAWRNGEFIVREGDSGNIFAVTMTGNKKLLTTVSAGSAAASAAQPLSMVFNDVAVDAAGNIYASGETDRVLYRFGSQP